MGWNINETSNRSSEFLSYRINGNEVLLPHVITKRRPMGRDFILTQDNACLHVAARSYLEVNIIKLLPHPADSPDLNTIENVWDVMGRRLRNLEIQDSYLKIQSEHARTFWRGYSTPRW